MNWKIRIQSKSFWLALIPAVLLLTQVVMVPFGVTIVVDTLGAELAAIVNALFAVLAILGIAVDPTTPGIKDSSLNMSKTELTALTPDDLALAPDDSK